MHAVLVSVTIPEENQDQALKALEERVVPGVRQLPGVVAGYWLEPAGGHGYSTVLFETEEQAKAAAETVPERIPDVITLDFAQVQGVVAHF
jgi:hypothetical protein